MPEQRNVLVEAARIARGDILPLTQARAETLDALIVPAASARRKSKQLRRRGQRMPVDPDLRAPALAMHQTGKPLGFMCIAPAMLPKIFAFPLRMTIGTDLDTADVVEEMGQSSLARSTTSWWMKTTKWSPLRRICWRRTLRKPPPELRSWWPACWR